MPVLSSVCHMEIWIHFHDEACCTLTILAKNVLHTFKMKSGTKSLRDKEDQNQYHRLSNIKLVQKC